MGTAGQVDGLAGALLRCVDDPERIPGLQLLLDRYCHRLRNRLNSMKLSLYLARRLAGDTAGADWNRADSAYKTMETLVEQLQTICYPIRPAATEGDLNQWIGRLLPEWRRRLAGRSIQIEEDGPDEPFPTRLDWVRMAQGLDSLLADWAHAAQEGSTIRVSWGRSKLRDHLRFEAESPLLPPGNEIESLALPLLARVIRADQGLLTLSDDACSIELNWPADRP